MRSILRCVTVALVRTRLWGVTGNFSDSLLRQPVLRLAAATVAAVSMVASHALASGFCMHGSWTWKPLDLEPGNRQCATHAAG